MVGADVHVRPEGVAVIDEQRLAAVAEDDVEVRAGPDAAPEQVARQRDELRLGQEDRLGDAVAAGDAHAAAQLRRTPSAAARAGRCRRRRR